MVVRIENPQYFFLKIAFTILDRVADGSLSMDEAMRRNRRDFKRFYGREKAKDIFF